jgi:predicted protein tyrosine phosphatase
MIKEITQQWLNIINNNNEQHYCIVVSRDDFPYIADMCKDRNDVAFISIESSPTCAQHYLKDKIYHHLKSDKYNVLNICFDDISEDKVCRDTNGEEYKIYTMNEAQADVAYRFVKNNIGKHFIIHCRAGKSRSQAFYRFIMDCFSDDYSECVANKYNPCKTPNVEVLCKLKRQFYKDQNIF